MTRKCSGRPKFELAINLKTAKQIGSTIPPEYFDQSRSSYPVIRNLKSAIQNPKSSGGSR